MVYQVLQNYVIPVCLGTGGILLLVSVLQLLYKKPYTKLMRLGGILIVVAYLLFFVVNFLTTNIE